MVGVLSLLLLTLRVRPGRAGARPAKGVDTSTAPISCGAKRRSVAPQFFPSFQKMLRLLRQTRVGRRNRRTPISRDFLDGRDTDKASIARYFWVDSEMMFLGNGGDQLLMSVPHACST